MGFIRQRYKDVTGHRFVNGTLVYEFVRTDPSGPLWSLRCTCGRYWNVPHSRVTAALQGGAALVCEQCCVPTANAETTLSAMRRAERQRREQAEREAAERQRLANEKAAREQAWRKYLQSFQADHHRYAMQCIRQGTPLEETMSLERFAAQGDETRARIMAAVARAEQRTGG